MPLGSGGSAGRIQTNMVADDAVIIGAIPDDENAALAIGADGIALAPITPADGVLRCAIRNGNAIAGEIDDLQAHDTVAVREDAEADRAIGQAGAIEDDASRTGIDGEIPPVEGRENRKGG